VNIGPVTSEFKKGDYGIFAATGPQFDDRRSFGTLAFQNLLESLNFSFRALIGNHFSTSFTKVVRFGSITARVLASQAKAIVRTGKTWPQATKRRTGD